MMVEIGYPLPARSRHIQIFYYVFEVHRDAVPKKGRISVNNIGRRRIAELTIHADLFKFAKKRVGFALIHRIAKLADEIGSLDQFRLEALARRLRSLWHWKACHLDRLSNTCRIDVWCFFQSFNCK